MEGGRKARQVQLLQQIRQLLQLPAVDLGDLMERKFDVVIAHFLDLPGVAGTGRSLPPGQQIHAAAECHRRSPSSPTFELLPLYPSFLKKQDEALLPVPPTTHVHQEPDLKYRPIHP